jgi:hypothetical protein
MAAVAAKVAETAAAVVATATTHVPKVKQKAALKAVQHLKVAQKAEPMAVQLMVVTKPAVNVLKVDAMKAVALSAANAVRKAAQNHRAIKKLVNHANHALKVAVNNVSRVNHVNPAPMAAVNNESHVNHVQKVAASHESRVNPEPKVVVNHVSRVQKVAANRVNHVPKVVVNHVPKAVVVAVNVQSAQTALPAIQ